MFFLTRRRSAFTLLEVTIATATAGLFFFFAWLLIPRSIMVEKEMMLRDYANLLAQQELSDFRALPESVVSGVWRDASKVGPENCSFRVVSEIYAVDGFSLAELSEVQVAVHFVYRGTARALRYRAGNSHVSF